MAAFLNTYSSARPTTARIVGINDAKLHLLTHDDALLLLWPPEHQSCPMQRRPSLRPLTALRIRLASFPRPLIPPNTIDARLDEYEVRRRMGVPNKIVEKTSAREDLTGFAGPGPRKRCQTRLQCQALRSGLRMLYSGQARRSAEEPSFKIKDEETLQGQVSRSRTITRSSPKIKDEKALQDQAPRSSMRRFCRVETFARSRS